MVGTSISFLSLSVAICAAKAVYSLMKLIPSADKVTMISRGQNWTSIDFRLLEKRICSDFPETSVVVLNHPVDPKFTYPWRVLTEMFHIATSRAVVLDTYNPVVSLFRHKPELVVIQVWHALGAIKKFGLSAVGKDEGRRPITAEKMKMHKNYTFVSCASETTGQIYEHSFGVRPEQIIIAGSPRVDFLNDCETQLSMKALLRKKYQIEEGRKVVLYAPTFRGGRSLPLEQLADALDLNRFTLVFKRHPLDRLTLISDDRVVVPDEHEGIELLAVADFLITDYSAITFEAVIVGLPILFWPFDIEEYELTRGLAVDYFLEMPGPIFRDAEQLALALHEENVSCEKHEEFRKKYLQTLDFSNSQRIVSVIFGGTVV